VRLAQNPVAEQRHFRALKDVPSVSADGERVQLHMNAGLLVDMPHLTESGADGVMVGRGAQGRPWLIGALHRFLEGQEFSGTPPVERQSRILLEHYEDMLMHYGAEAGGRIARKHICWYSRELPGSAAFRAAVNRIDRPGEVSRLISEFYDAAAERMAA